MKQLNIFPTVITTTQRTVTMTEKLKWFNVIMANMNGEGKTHDYLGYQTLHHHEEVADVYKDISDVVYKHLSALGLRTYNIDVNITKSFANLCKNNKTPLHDHSECHYSFVYYPNVPVNNKQVLMFSRKSNNPNEPVSDFIGSNTLDYAVAGADFHEIDVSEGMIVVFPSSLPHMTMYKHDYMEQKATYDLEPVHDINDLHDYRVCIAGDCILTRKNNKGYRRMIMPVESWRKFNE